MSAGGNLSKTPFSMINATKAIKRSLSRENSPISVKSQLDFDNVEVPKMKTPRKSKNQKGELLGTITARRSVRLSITPRKIYKE